MTKGMSPPYPNHAAMRGGRPVAVWFIETSRQPLQNAHRYTSSHCADRFQWTCCVRSRLCGEDLLDVVPAQYEYSV
jgi:hypothetical protein